MAYLTSDNMPLPVQREALYPTGSTGTIPGGNTSTAFSIPLGSLELSGSTSLFDAQTATIVIANNGTAKTINAATLIFTDMVGAQASTISYVLSSVSVANNTSSSFTVSLNSGILKNMSLVVTFASAPTAGSADIQAALQSGAASSGGGGGSSSDVAIHDNSTPANHLRVNSDGSINVNGGSAASSVALNDGTTTSQKATIDGSGNLHVLDARTPVTGQATMASSLPVVIASNQSAIPISGSITATNPSVGTDGSAIPTSSTLIGGSDGINLQPLQVDGSRYLKVNVAAGSLSASNPSVGTDGSTLPTSSTLIGASDGTNLQQLLVESASNRNLRTSIFNGTNEAAVDGLGNLKVTHGGATQVIDVLGNIASAVQTGTDAIAQQGVPAGSQQLASPFSTTIAASIATGSRTVTPAAMSGTNRGAPWSIQVGSLLSIDTGSNNEIVKVTAVASTTFTATFAKAHTGPGIVVAGEVLNQARDATTDPTTGAGMSPGAVYLYNATLNSGAGGWEPERSALGELDNASGTGTAIAAEYHWTGQGYDRARNVLGKGLGSGNITSGGTNGSQSVTMSAAPTGLQPGSPIMFYHGSTQEMLYTTNAYVAGTSPILLQTAITMGTHTNAQWDVFAMMGPQMNGMLAHGIPLEQETVYDPASGMYYQIPAATQDAMPATNVPMENVGLWNGTSLDRLKGTIVANAANVAVANGTSNPIPIAGLNPSSTLQALQTDASGNLLTTATSATYEYNSGGPVPSSTSIPSQLGLDRVRNLQGTGTANGSITSTNPGDTAVAFSSAPLTLLGGSPIFLSGGGNPIEVVYASDSFVPGTGVVSVPIKSTVRYASHTTATWSIFATQGPQGSAFLPDGIGARATVLYDPNASAPSQYEVAQGDGGAMRVSLYGKNTTLADTPLQLDGSGNLKVTTASGVATNVSIADPTTPSQKVAVNASGAIMVNLAQQNGTALPGAVFMGSNGVTATNVPEHGIGVYNGSTIDQLYGDANAARVSLYGKNATAGDTPIKSDSSGNLNVKIASSSVTQTTSIVATAGGTSGSHTISAASNNPTLVKSSSGMLFGYEITNTNASFRYVKMHNTASAPTAGSTVVARTIGVPPGSRVSLQSTTGIVFSTGIAFTTTTGIADSDATTVGANDLSIDLDYK